MTRTTDSMLTRGQRVVYRIATGIVASVMIFSVINFTFNDHFPFPNGPEGGFVHLGFPWYFKIELTVAKTLGLLALLIPNIPRKVKEFAYFGFGITLLSASIAHLGRGDARISALLVVDPLVFLGLLAVSYYYFDKSHSTVVATAGAAVDTSTLTTVQPLVSQTAGLSGLRHI